MFCRNCSQVYFKFLCIKFCLFLFFKLFKIKKGTLFGISGGFIISISYLFYNYFNSFYILKKTQKNNEINFEHKNNFEKICNKERKQLLIGGKFCE